MNKRKHNLIIISILFALLLGVLFLLISMPSADKDEPQTDNTPVLENIINTSDKKIVSVTVKNSSGTYDIISKERDDKQVYVLSGANEGKTSENMTSTFIESIINLKPSQVIEENSNDLSIYGLDESRAELTVNFDNNDKIVLNLGNDAPLSKGSYIRVNDESKVYLISEVDKEIFLNDEHFYMTNEE